MTETPLINRPSTTLNALLAQALRIATPSWIDSYCEVRTFNALRRETVAATPDGSFSYCLALCADEDCEEPGSHVGLIAELIGPAGQLLGHAAIWGIQEPETYSDAAVQPFLQVLAEYTAELLTEVTDVASIRRQLIRRENEIHHALGLLCE
jgi:hypothetical protein